MNKHPVHPLAVATLLALAGAAAHADDNTFKFGLIRYTTDSRTDGIHGVGVPAGADAKTGNANTLLLVYERTVSPHVGVELVVGIPPKISAKATGTAAFLGDDVLSARIIAPTLIANYHFGDAGDTWRPYLGAGINYTKFTHVKSKLAPDVKIADSMGPVIQGGVDYALTREWGLFGSVAKIWTKSKLVATGSTVLTTTIDFRPVTYQVGATYKF
jgi:outer membrane protein